MVGVISEPTTVLNLSDISGWTKVSADTHQMSELPAFLPGDEPEECYNYKSASGVASFVDHVIDLDLSGGGFWEIDVYSGLEPWTDAVLGQRFGVFFSQDVSYANSVNVSGHTLWPGWNAVRLSRGQRIDSADPGISALAGNGHARQSTNIRLRCRTESITSKELTTGIRGLYIGAKEKTLVCPCVDDGHVDGEAIVEACIANNIPITVAVIWNKVGTTGYSSLSTLLDWLSTGLVSFVSHTLDHEQGKAATEDEEYWADQIGGCSQALEQNGLSVNNSHLIHVNPYGASSQAMNDALDSVGMIQAFTVVGRAQSFRFACNPHYAARYVHDSYSASGVSGGGGASFNASSMSQFLRRVSHAVGCGGVVCPTLHRAMETPNTSIACSLSQLNEFVAYLVRLKSYCDFGFLTDAVQYSRQYLGLAPLY